MVKNDRGLDQGRSKLSDIYLNQAFRGVEVVPDLEIIIDKKIKEVSDIENIFKLKLMDKVNIKANTLFLNILQRALLKRTIKAFYDLATTSTNEHIQENTLSAIRNMSGTDS